MNRQAQRILLAVVLASGVGIFSGVLSSTFLHCLNYVTDLREGHRGLLWGLPIFGFVLGRVLLMIPNHIHQGVPYILNEIDHPKTAISPLMAPFIFISSIATHLFGGSAGREGVGVIMGASIAHLVPRKLIEDLEFRRVLIFSGMAAGFSSIFGTPIAAIAFVFELHRFADLRNHRLLVATSLSSIVGYVVSLYLGPQHQHFQVGFEVSGGLAGYLMIAAFTSGVGGHVFYWALKGYSHYFSIKIPRLEWKLFWGAVLIVMVVTMTNGYSYIGIGTGVISQAFGSPMEMNDFIMKCMLTVMTLAIGFKGGEVTPLFFMGAVLSNSVASQLELGNYALSASLGMAGLFGAVAGVPMASALMGAELFGWKVGFLCLPVCLLARLMMGDRSVYRH